VVCTMMVCATSHEGWWVDYCSAVRVFTWARTSPSSSSLRPIIMHKLARRMQQTRCWAVALTALMVPHDLLILRSHHAGRHVPAFLQLAEFHDRSSSPAKSVAFSAFVRVYYRFLD
jgi:hypothetical protein